MREIKEIYRFHDFSYSLAQLRALGVPVLMPLLGSPQEVSKKRAKGSNTLWKPRTRHEKSKIFLIVARRYANSEFALPFEGQTATRKTHASREASTFSACYAPLFAKF